MNAPQFDFGSGRRDRGLPTPVTGDGRDLMPGGGPTLAAAGPAAVEPDRPKLQDQFFKYLGLAIKHRWLILACCVSGLVTGLLVTFTSTPIYRATASIKIDLIAARVVKLDTPGDPDGYTGDARRFYQTQYEILKSRSLAERVASNLDLRADSGFVNPPPSSSWGKLRRMIFPEKPREKLDLAQRKAAAASLIEGGLTVFQAPNSSIVRISFDNPDPVWTQTIANAVAQGFTDANLERRYGSTAYARKFLEEKLADLKIKLEDSEKALVAYAEKEQIITSKSKDQQPLADSDLVSLNAALQQVRAERIRAEEQWDQASKTKELILPQVLNDKSIMVLREKRAVLASDYQEKLATFKPDYPDMRRLKAQIAQFDAEIDRAVTVIKGSLKSHYESLRQQEEMLQKNIEDARGKVLTDRNKNIQMQILQREADSTRTLYDGLLQQYKDIGVAGATGTNNVSVIDRAEVPGAPYKPNLWRNLQLWFLLGLLGAAAAVAALEIWDDTFKSPEDIEDQLGLTVLGLIPRIKENIFECLRDSPVSGISEAYRSLRTALQFSTSNGLPRTLVVTSPKAGEGKSTTSVALAVNFAQLGMKVLLIDADLRNPSAHRLLGREAERGLTNYLVGTASAEDILQATEVSGLMFMASGPVPPNPAELLAGQNMARLLSTASEHFDAVIVDAPPILGLADAPLLANVAAGTLLVLGAGEARRGVVKTALKRLHFARAQVIGVVMNKFDMRAASYAYHSYGYGALEYYGSGSKSLAKTPVNQI
jgi:polysaccharide biosynthesis transport protein